MDKRTGNKRYTKPTHRKGDESEGKIEEIIRLRSPRFKLQPKPILKGLEAGKEFKIMQKIKIYKNYICLANKTSIVYTHMAEAEMAVKSEKITVKIPDEWELHEIIPGLINCKAPWGIEYSVAMLLAGNEYPCFAAYDLNGNFQHTRLEIID